jgi:hypothetical protein
VTLTNNFNSKKPLDFGEPASENISAGPIDFPVSGPVQVALKQIEEDVGSLKTELQELARLVDEADVQVQTRG